MPRAFPQAAALALALALATPAAEAQALIDATRVDDIVRIARDYGTAERDTDSAGDPMITGDMDGTTYVVFFYGCTEGADCTTIQFIASWVNPGAVDEAMLHSWNREKRFGKAYLDDENDPVLEMNVNLFGGVSETNLSDTFDWWRVVLETYVEYIGFDKADTPAAPASPAVREADTPPAVTGAPSALGMGSSTQPGGGKVKVNQ